MASSEGTAMMGTGGRISPGAAKKAANASNCSQAQAPAAGNCRERGEEEETAKNEKLHWLPVKEVLEKIVAISKAAFPQDTMITLDEKAKEERRKRECEGVRQIEALLDALRSRGYEQVVAIASVDAYVGEGGAPRFKFMLEKDYVDSGLEKWISGLTSYQITAAGLIVFYLPLSVNGMTFYGQRCGMWKARYIDWEEMLKCHSDPCGEASTITISVSHTLRMSGIRDFAIFKGAASGGCNDEDREDECYDDDD